MPRWNLFTNRIRVLWSRKLENVNSNLRDLIVEKGPTRDITSNLDFQKDENSQHFSIIHYTRK